MRSLTLGLLCMCWLVISAAATTPTRLPADSFFGLSNISQPRLSPDGSKIAFLLPHEGRMALGVMDRKTNDARLVVQGRDEGLRGFFWKGDDRLVFYADVAGNESMFLAATDLSGKRVVRLAESQQRENSVAGATLVLEDELPQDPERILVRGFFAPDETANLTMLGGDVVVARLNIRSKARSTLETLRESDNNFSFLADQAGRLRIRSRIAGSDLIWEHREDDSKAWRRIARHPFHGYAETWMPLKFDADGRRLYLLSRENHDRGALVVLDTISMELSEPLFVPEVGEITGLVFSRDGRTLRGVAYEDVKRHYHWFDAGRAALQSKLENSFVGMTVTVVSSSLDEKVLLVHVGSDRDPGAYFVLDTGAGSLATLRRIREIDPRLMRPMEPIAITARDGLELNGYLTRPEPLPDARKPSLIILPHGGPFGIRDSWGFDPEVQFLANRGHAVLQVNYRGSGGYGRSFIDRGRHQWGRAMQDDLTDAVRWAITQGIADPDRIAIMGASYGGYAALAGVTLTPELYRCAVNYVGAADLEITFKDLGDDAFARNPALDYRANWVGPTREYRAATSPVNHVSAIRVPTLHAYGKKDPRVKIDHWTRLEAELKKHGKSYVAIEEKRQGHGFRDPKAAVPFYTAVEKFLARHLSK